jgi:hypothetical protein
MYNLIRSCKGGGMYQEKPWTLERERRESPKNKSKNALTLVENYLKKNKNKIFTMLDIAYGVNRCKASVSVALVQLKESGKVKIIGVREASNNCLVGLYQHISGPNKSIPVIDLGNEKGKGLVTPRVFMKENAVINETKFRYSIEESRITKYLVKTSSSYAYAYKEKDLKKILKSHRKVKRSKIQFKVFKWTITIE